MADDAVEAQVAAWLRETLATQARLLDDAATIARVAQLVRETLRGGGKLLLFGNGGSAADAQHIAAEFVSRFRRDRRALPAIALTTDTSILTAIGNDLSFDQVFARQVEALARPGDLVAGISTSGQSPDVLAGLRAARACGATTVGFTGRGGGAMPPLCDLCFHAPADDTAHIQEAHIAAWHAVCAVVEEALFGPA